MSQRNTGDEVAPGSAAEPAAEPAEAPLLPTDVRLALQVGQFILLLLCVLSVARDLVLPMVLAFVLKLLLEPAMRLLGRLGLPRTAAALLLILAVFGILVGLVTALAGPAADWAARLPEGIPRLQERLAFLSGPIEAVRHFLAQIETYARGGGAPAPAAISVQPTGLSQALFVGTSGVAGDLFTTLLLLFFLLVSGNTFLRRLVEVLPTYRNKRQAVEISQRIEDDVSAYLATITVINAVVGLASAGIMWACGVGDPVLWGAVAFLLNYVPILGPMVTSVVFLLAGLLSAETLWLALLPAGLYFAVHIAEGETITPLLLARRFTLNPVLVVAALVFWHWMWGIPGAILAVPMLAIAKIVCDRIASLAALGHLLGD
jgi:predicted PurR-regulated permease PerM